MDASQDESQDASQDLPRYMCRDKTKPDAWFEFEFNAYSGVADYANEPPRGMTNPPMNLKLRNVLCKDLVEFGLELEVPSWTGGFTRTSSSTPTSPSQTLFPRQRLARGAQSRLTLMSSYHENVRSGQTLKKGTIFNKSAPAVVTVSAEESASPHPPWHEYHPFPHMLRPIDRKGPVNLVSPSKSVASAVTEKEKRTVRFVDSPKSLADTLAQGGGPSPTEFIKTPSHDKAIQLGKRMTLNDPSGKRPSSEPPGMAKKGKDPGKDLLNDEDEKSKHSNVIDEKELENRMMGMRGMSQLHRAAVADRFRFGANASAGHPMVLGAANLSNANPGNWASDAAALTKFHNAAIRIVNPSGLEVLKEPASKRKKKKKKQDDEEDLKMSDSGLFVARYPIDEALVKLRRLKKKTFPEEEKPEPTQQEMNKEACLSVAAKLKLDLGGFLLSRVRDSAADHADQDAALAASGYAEPHPELVGLPA